MDSIRDAQAELRGEDAAHLARVLRAEPGQQYQISDNHRLWLAEIVEARKDCVIFRVLEPLEAPALPLAIHLYAALIKFDRFEWMIEKATELGAASIIPVETARSEKGLFEAAAKRSERWGRVARESSQQSRRLRIPEIPPALRLDAALRAEADHRWRLEEDTAPGILGALPAQRAAGSSAAVLIGPEGGWTESERERCAEAGWHAVSLGPQVLRAETAAAAAIAILIAAWQVE